MPYGMTAPTINPNTFPYLKKFTPEEREDLLERIERLRHDLTDMVGPSGVVMYLDAGTIANIAFHLAMVGYGDEPPEAKAYIWADEQPDQDGIFEGFIDWKLKKEHRQPPKKKQDDPELVARKVAAAREQMVRQLDPEVYAALRSKLAEEFVHDTTDPTPDKDGEK
jgi:hypothetical protein